MSPPPRSVKPAAFPNADLLCFSHLRWNFVFQRPQHLLSRASRTFRVQFFEEPRFEPQATPRLERMRAPEGVEVLVPILPEGMGAAEAAQAQRSLLDAHLDAMDSAPRVGWYYTPMALTFSEHVRFPVCVYDCMDELTGFKGAPQGLAALERRLFSRASLVFTGGVSLYEAKRHQHDNVHAFPSSIDAAHFLPAREPWRPEPEDMLAIPRPRIGFFGVIDERLDLDLVGRVARLRPDWQIVMIGPVVKIDPAALPQADNIHWLGAKAYAELPQYLAGLDVGWMPFALNEATRFISPTKTPEFLAAGLPVVSTPVIDVVRSWGAVGLVEIAATATETVAAIADNLGRARNAGFLAQTDRQLARTSWDETWRRMSDLIDGAAAGSRRKPERPALPRAADVASHV